MRRLRLLRHPEDFRTASDGSVAITVGIAMAALIGSAALSVDVGTFFLAKRNQQAATDIAAIVAAGHIANATQAVATALADNKVAASAQASIEYGTYVADSATAPDQRFRVAPQSAADSIRISVVNTAPLYFGSAIAALSSGSPQGVAIRTQATASQANFAAFAVGSRLTSLNGGIANAILGKMLGVQLSLSVMDYEALASAQVDLFALSQALASRISTSAITYGQLTSTSVRVSDLFAALRDSATVGSTNVAAKAALAAIAQSKAGSGDLVPLAALVDYGSYALSQISANTPMTARLSVLDIIAATAQIAGRRQTISLDLSGSVPSLAAVKLILAIGERPVGTSFVQLGRTGAQVQTAQTRLLLTARLSAAAPLLSLSAPIVISLASATATLSSLACDPGPGTPSATLDVLPSLADAWIGTASAADLSDFSITPRIVPGPMATVLGLATIDGSAHVTAGSATPSRLAYSPADIANATKHTASSSNLVSSLTRSLAASLQVSVEPIGVAAPQPVTQAVTRGLGDAALLIDPVLDGILTILGLHVGEADAWISGVKCSGGVLVN